MQRYFLDDQQQIKKDDWHHILTVMRMQSGDEIELCTTTGDCFLAKLVLEKTPFKYEIIKLLDSADNTGKITLIQGIGKGDKNEFVVKYATQFGVDQIIFIEMKRSISKMDDQTWHKKKDRYDKIALESARLAHRNTVPTIDFLPNIKALNGDFSHAFVAYENDRKAVFLDKIEGIKNVDSIALLIGPEGGIDELEMALLKDKGFISVGLGNRILQTEVACLYGLAIIDGVLERKR